MYIATSKNNVFIRLTAERLRHIVENHDELQGMRAQIMRCIEKPDIIVSGEKDEYLAVTKYKTKWLIVVYKEVSKKDGFIITAFITSRITYIIKKEIVWKKQ